MSEDSGSKPQINADERRCGLDLFISLGKGKLAPESLRKAPGLTPLNFNVETHNRNTNTGSVGEIFSTTESALNPWFINEPEKNNELIRTETNSGTEILRNSSGLSVKSSGLTPLGQGTETQGRLSGLSVPLSLCGVIHKKEVLE